MRRLAWGLILGASVLALVLLLPFTDILELKSLDLRFQVRGRLPLHAPVVIVTIDDESFRDIGMRWPWPRSYFAQAIERAAKDGAAVIGLDLMLPDLGYSEEEDQALARAIAEAGNVVIPAKFEASRVQGYTARSLNLPLPVFADPAAAIGYVNLLQSRDGFVRSIKPCEHFQEELHLSFPAAVLTAAGLAPPGLASEGPQPSGLGPGASFCRDEVLHINFAGPAGTFPTLSFSKVMQGEFPQGTFRGRIVLIGAWYRESHDLFSTPFFQSAPKAAAAAASADSTADADSAMYGVEVHANALETLFSGRYIRPWSRKQILLFLALISFAGALVLINLTPLRGLAAAAGFACVLTAGAFAAFGRSGMWVRLSEPLFILGFSYTGAVFYRYFAEERENRQIQGLFSRYVSRQVVSQILADPDRVRLGGETRDVVIFFSDIRGFTSLTERTGPEEVVSMLNDFFREMADVVFKYEGTVNKYIGDALLAFYGAPIAHADDAERAVLACLEMRDRLHRLNQERTDRGKDPISVGMGVHRGEVVVGNIGSPERMEYTAIGDAVNTCQRVESLTRQLDAGILITEQVYREVRGLIRVRAFDPVSVKGKREPLRIFEVLDAKGESDD